MSYFQLVTLSKSYCKCSIKLATLYFFLSHFFFLLTFPFYSLFPNICFKEHWHLPEIMWIQCRIHIVIRELEACRKCQNQIVTSHSHWNWKICFYSCSFKIMLLYLPISYLILILALKICHYIQIAIMYSSIFFGMSSILFLPKIPKEIIGLFWLPSFGWSVAPKLQIRYYCDWAWVLILIWWW